MGDTVTIQVKLNSTKSEVSGYTEDNVLKVYVKSPPEKGKANREVQELLSKHFKKTAEIIKGFNSRKKVVRLWDF